VKIAIRKKKPGKDGRRLIAFYDDNALVYDHAAEELKYLSGLRVPAVVCFEQDGILSGWKAKLLTFHPDSYEPITVHLENFLHPWIDAGIRLAASDFKMSAKRGYSATVELSLGKHEKPLYHLVWERWRVWQSDQHSAEMRHFTLAAGAHEDLARAFPKIGKRFTARQVQDACKRLKLPLAYV
jgi:hypothetical protein